MGQKAKKSARPEFVRTARFLLRGDRVLPGAGGGPARGHGDMPLYGIMDRRRCRPDRWSTAAGRCGRRRSTRLPQLELTGSWWESAVIERLLTGPDGAVRGDQMSSARQRADTWRR